jgi:DNA-binding NtrC family response regulator
MVPVNARIVAATNRELETEVEQQRFREDLFYRLNVVQISVPPLRTRDQDVLLLAQQFLHKFASKVDKGVTGFSSEAAKKLLEYDWPGNVRQLENAIERAVTLTRFEQITVGDLPDRISRYEAAKGGLWRCGFRAHTHMGATGAALYRKYAEGGARKQDASGELARCRPAYALPQARALRGIGN